MVTQRAFDFVLTQVCLLCFSLDPNYFFLDFLNDLSICFYFLRFYCTVSGFYPEPVQDYRFPLPLLKGILICLCVFTYGHCMLIPCNTTWLTWTLKFFYLSPLHLASLSSFSLMTSNYCGKKINQFYIFSASLPYHLQCCSLV